jgi:mycothiol synthase
MADIAPATPVLVSRLTAAEQQQVLALVERAAGADGHRAVNDAGLLALRHAGASELSDPGVAEATTESDRSVHVLARDPATTEVVGYAQAVWEPEGPVAALVVDPEHRRRGIGSALWRTLAATATLRSPQAGVGAPLRVWATGNSPAAQALAAGQGLTAVRTLLVLGRSLSGDLPPADPLSGITIRTFRPGDEDGWLAVNARAFATHPEQGAMTRADLDQRMAEPWFDPNGLFLAVRDNDDQIIGFHWTKREPGAPTGEVYVIGVDPTAGVRGLGTPLLGAGLRHLRATGAVDVDLYVEADNVPALALYRRYGFSPVTADVMYAAPADPAVASA